MILAHGADALAVDGVKKSDVGNVVVTHLRAERMKKVNLSECVLDVLRSVEAGAELVHIA